jgi:hypothetical protein
LSNYTNGGAVFRAFEPVDPVEFDDASRNDPQGLDHLLRSFLHSPAVVAAMTDIKLTTEHFPPYHYYTPYALFWSALRGKRNLRLTSHD